MNLVSVVHIVTSKSIRERQKERKPLLNIEFVSFIDVFGTTRWLWRRSCKEQRENLRLHGAKLCQSDVLSPFGSSSDDSVFVASPVKCPTPKVGYCYTKTDFCGQAVDFYARYELKARGHVSTTLSIKQF
jgi:hypothetical protein